MMFGGSRLIIEYFRESEVVFAGMSVAQLVCAEIVISSAILLVFRLRTARRKEVLEIGRS